MALRPHTELFMDFALEEMGLGACGRQRGERILDPGAQRVEHAVLIISEHGDQSDAAAIFPQAEKGRQAPAAGDLLDNSIAKTADGQRSQGGPFERLTIVKRD